MVALNDDPVASCIMFRFLIITQGRSKTGLSRIASGRWQLETLRIAFAKEYFNSSLTSRTEQVRLRIHEATVSTLAAELEKM